MIVLGLDGYLLEFCSAVIGELFKCSVNRVSSSGDISTAGSTGSGKWLSASAFSCAVVLQNFNICSNSEK